MLGRVLCIIQQLADTDRLAKRGPSYNQMDDFADAWTGSIRWAGSQGGVEEYASQCAVRGVV